MLQPLALADYRVVLAMWYPGLETNIPSNIYNRSEGSGIATASVARQVIKTREPFGSHKHLTSPGVHKLSLRYPAGTIDSI
jgi:hypothetical protein